MNTATLQKKAYLLLEDSTLLEGTAIGAVGTSGGEICFNTGMTGYQEIYTDPSYSGQVILHTNAHIGNYGTFDGEQESESPKINGLIVNEFSFVHSRSDSSGSLQQYLEKHNIVGIADVDTRKLVRHIRSKGVMNVIISSSLGVDQLPAELDKLPSMEGLELSSRVCTKQAYTIGDESAEHKVAVLDLGIKKSILKNLTLRGVYCKVFPARTSFEVMNRWKPTGYFISNGPGDPKAMDYAVDTVQQILDTELPTFGICLGHQIIARSCGISTYKMHHGHRGLNHPIKNLITGKSEITSQNHGFVVNKEEVEANDLLEITHIHLNDGTIAGLKLKNKKAFSVQYHPEASPGPHDSRYLFDDFIQLMNS